MQRIIRGLVVFVLFAAGLSGCGVLGGNSAEPAAKALAEQLSDHTLTGFPLTQESGRGEFEAAVAEVKDVPVAVKAKKVDTSGDKATVTLSWSWNLGEQKWSYDTTARLVQSKDEWRLEWRPEMLAGKLGAGERLRLRTTPAERGRVLGAGGSVLVEDRQVFRYGIDKTKVERAQWASTARSIASAVEIDAKAYEKRLLAAGEKAFVEAIVLRPDDTTAVDSELRGTTGALKIRDEIPLAPTKGFAGPLLGSVGAATASLIEASKGKIREGDQVGLSGLQYRYDAQLRGSRGFSAQAIAQGKDPRVLFDEPAVAGRDLKTTLDSQTQQKAERALAGNVRSEGPHSAVVVIRPSTGEILAAANGPGNEGFNAATEGQYAPGSTFKIVTSLALLREGVSASDPVNCPVTTMVDGRQFENYDDYPSGRTGRISFRTALANSCNTAFITSRERIEPGTMAEAGAALGLGVDHDLGFPAYFGQIPTPGGETERAAETIGQGKVLASPLAMAAVAASVASGETVVPSLIAGRKVDEKSPGSPLKKAEAQGLRDLMRAVVTEGSGGFLANLPGAVGAKTGTAEYGKPDSDGKYPLHAWMIATASDLAVAVFVEEGASGSATAGPILEDFLR